MAIHNINDIITDFRNDMTQTGIAVPQLNHTVIQAGVTHRNRTPKNLPPGMDVVYIFSTSAAYGQTCPVGADQPLRVGMASVDGRITQNYNLYDTGLGLPSKLENPLFWRMLGLQQVRPGQGFDWKLWIEDNLDRNQIELPKGNSDVLKLLEKYVRACVRPLFEG